MAIILTAVPMADINLSSGWGKVWGAVTAGFPALPGMLTFIGTALVIWAVAKWAWDRRRGGNMGQGAQAIGGALIIGGVLLAPTVLLPLALTILDGVANIAVQAFKTMTGGGA
jgi:hypothetical protein